MQSTCYEITRGQFSVFYWLYDGVTGKVDAVVYSHIAILLAEFRDVLTPVSVNLSG